MNSILNERVIENIWMEGPSKMLAQHAIFDEGVANRGNPIVNFLDLDIALTSVAYQ